MRKAKLSPEKMLEVISYYTKIPLDSLDKLAIFATADLVARGLTNKQVAIVLGIDEEGVLEDLSALSEFKGFCYDNVINPNFVYDRFGGHKDQFVLSMMTKVDEIDALQLYDFMVEYKKLKKELDEIYGIT